MRTLLTIGITLTCLLGGAQERSILLKGGTAHLGNGQVIKNSLVGMENGELTLVRNALTLTIDPNDWDTIIDVTGKHVYPGFILTNNRLGLVEVDAVRASRDFVETGQINPNVRAMIAFNTDSDIVPTVRQNGVLITQCTPQGGGMSGSSAMMRMQAWNWEDAVIRADDGTHLQWPNKTNRWEHLRDHDKKPKEDHYGETLEEIEKFFTEARAYLEVNDRQEKDLRFEAMRGVFGGDKRVYIHVDFTPEIQDVVEMQRKLRLAKPVIVGGYDAWHVGDVLSDLNIPVVLTRLHSLPEFDEDPVDHVYSLPKKLHDAGVKFCLSYSGDMEAMGSRNLPFVAGTATAYGLSEEEAVRSITLSAAEITGIDKKYGSLEKGKSATLFVSEGDALDMMTNYVIMAWTDGSPVDLSSRQKELYQKYRQKYASEKDSGTDTSKP